MNVLVVGASGLCGSFFLKYALESTKVAKVYTLTRSPSPPAAPQSEKLVALVEPDGKLWGHAVRGIPGDLDVLLSALGTTRAAAGAEGQYAVDHDLCVAVARAARNDKNCKSVALVSSAGAHTDSRFFYTRMKGDTERDIAALAFPHAVFLRPGILLGQRTTKHTGFGNVLATKVGQWLYRSKCQSLIWYPVKGSEVAQVGLQLALDTEGTKPRVDIVASNEILNLAKQ
ncbi:Fmp52p KNAG_0L00925 [Huiozyma naganishii CBS 8797]|uniref:NAD(P)-binding domain-containing protein n=1 Tax=Huiozyma naganishii (strain ATCC MYA-139 / BCRC 22969 / CBS 8797 / KCTC 17520 / NBRC 10181 / NCYC 3082 / Yp74L-3) TaxID=1071383 RepID=J7SAF8_HUIN7|nr:hypothetical protein KNAG_0L00925 [Kazachstania naganishii CBS 8797]CCK72714.1 hypothetical protein KNAG_0L00925 [Kazachstania naganishii CBS 8797]